MSDDRQIEDLLSGAAERVRVEKNMPAEVRRRIRIRRVGTAAISLSVVVGLITGGVLATGTWSPPSLPPSEERGEREESDAPEIVVTRDDPSLPEGCGVQEAAEGLLSFTEAVSDGDLEALDEALSDEKTFGRVAIPGPDALTDEANIDRDAVMSYFESRFSHNESYRLAKVVVETEVQNQRGTALQVSFFAVRQADDIEGAQRFRGEAGFDCPAGDIYGLVGGPPHPTEPIESWCPTEPPASADVVIACTRRADGKRSVIFPVADYYSGEESGTEGILTRRGRCLYLRPKGFATLTFPVWPPGFYAHGKGQKLTVRDGSGRPVVEIGSSVEMAGGFYDGKGIPPGFEDEWKSCAPASSYFVVSYIADDDERE